MSLSATCVSCGCGAGMHFTHCPIVTQTSATVPAPQPTAYDRAQAELERKIGATFDSLKRKGDRIERLEERLDAALRRIEALELEVAKLKGPQPAYAQAVDQKLKNIAASMSVVMECAGIELPDEGT